MINIIHLLSRFVACVHWLGLPPSSLTKKQQQQQQKGEGGEGGDT